MEEYASPWQTEYITTLQAAQHAIDLRKLAGRALAHFHKPPAARSSAVADFGTQAEELHAEMEDWFRKGCLLARLEPGEAPVQITIPWLNVNYHEVLALVYSPSRSNPTLVELSKLQEILGRYVQSAFTQFQEQHLALNHTTVNRLLVVGRQLLHCHAANPPTCAADASDLRGLTFKCSCILPGFSPEWASAEQAAMLFDRFDDELSRLERRMQAEQAAAAVAAAAHVAVIVQGWEEAPIMEEGAAAVVHPDSIPAIVEQWVLLLRQVLGPSSVYNFLSGTELPRPASLAAA